MARLAARQPAGRRQPLHGALHACATRPEKLMPRGNKLTVAYSTTGDKDFPVGCF
jgi:hypothetical protein